MSPSLNFPSRPTSALGGTAFLQSILNIGPSPTRDSYFLQELASGNIPTFLQTFQEILTSDGTNILIYSVSPDVLCVGSDQDYVRLPVTPMIAKTLGTAMGWTLPTAKMARQIWQYADLKLIPTPKGPPYDTSMQLTETFIWHNQVLNQQIINQSYSMVTGHKKDVILHPRLLQYPNNVCIYGWIYPNGTIIQNPPQYTAHSASYYDYSHSIRMVSRNANLNGQEIDLWDVLKDPKYAGLISDEGAYDASRFY